MNKQEEQEESPFAKSCADRGHCSGALLNEIAAAAR